VPAASVSLLSLICLKESVTKFLLTRSVDAESLIEIVFDASVLSLDLIERRSQVLRFHAQHILWYRRVAARCNEVIDEILVAHPALWPPSKR
jgi:hypothetical protein